MQFLKLVREKMAVLHMKDELLHRGEDWVLQMNEELEKRKVPDKGAGRG